MRVLISGGPGAGCTSTAELIGAEFGVPVFDSDAFFHKPTDPPFQEPYSADERRQRLVSALGTTSDWILSGSIATWGVDLPAVPFGVFLDPPKEERMRRLGVRERERFGSRIDVGGDLHLENKDFMEWASGYEEGSGRGRNRSTDHAFLVGQCDCCLEIRRDLSLDEVVAEIRDFLSGPISVARA